jgi:ubiquinone/menaquinone biosynthesis C-methylase UbiE
VKELLRQGWSSAAAEVPTVASAYDRIARLYDPWSRSVVEDVAFYVAEARKAGGRAGMPPGTPVVELGVGTGRIAVPVAANGIDVIGVDTSQGMLEVCRSRAEAAGVADRLDLRIGDFRDPPVTERSALVMCPFRAYLHLSDDTERLTALEAARRMLVPGGLLAFDVFAPSREDVEDTHGRWIEREPGIWERAHWDEDARRLTLDVRGDAVEATLGLSWISAAEWRRLLEHAGLQVEACYGWFDRSPYTGGEDSIWLARRA